MPKRKTTDSDPKTFSGTGADGAISFTSRNPPWAYMQLELVTHSSTSTPAANKHTASLDAVTARTYLTSALSQFLGLTGTAIPIDILKHETTTAATVSQPAPKSRPQSAGPNTLWIRVPYADATAVIAAVSSWVGGDSSGVAENGAAFRVRSRGGSLSALTAGEGGDMFVP